MGKQRANTFQKHTCLQSVDKSAATKSATMQLLTVNFQQLHNLKKYIL